MFATVSVGKGALQAVNVVDVDGFIGPTRLTAAFLYTGTAVFVGFTLPEKVMEKVPLVLLSEIPVPG